MSMQASSSSPSLLATISAGRLDHMADVPCTTPTFVVTAVLFNLLFLYSIFLFFRNRAWFFAAFSVALGLEAGGFTALSYLSTHLTHHTAYLISFSTLTLAPCFLILAILAAFARLMSNVEHAEQHYESKTVILSRGWVVAIFMLAEVLVILHFVLGIADLSALHDSTPMLSKDDAFARLVFQAEAVSHLNTGYIIQVVCLGLFILIGYLSMSIEHITIDSEWGDVRWAIQSVTAFSLIRTAVKASTYATRDHQVLDILSSGTATWLIDVLPLIFGFAIFMKHYAAITRPSSKQASWWSSSEKTVRLSYDSASSC